MVSGDDDKSGAFPFLGPPEFEDEPRKVSRGSELHGTGASVTYLKCSKGQSVLQANANLAPGSGIPKAAQTAPWKVVYGGFSKMAPYWFSFLGTI